MCLRVRETQGNQAGGLEVVGLQQFREAVTLLVRQGAAQAVGPDVRRAPPASAGPAGPCPWSRVTLVSITRDLHGGPS